MEIENEGIFLSYRGEDTRGQGNQGIVEEEPQFAQALLAGQPSYANQMTCMLNDAGFLE